jgi:flagellar P-ring protein FlgI
MIHRFRVSSCPPRWAWALGCMAMAFFGIMGCVNPMTYFQDAKEVEKERDLDVRTIADVTQVTNLQPLPVSGVGLVTGLSGTGGSPPAGLWRKMMEEELRRQKVEHIKEILELPDNALVLISGGIRAGSRKGDTFDIELTLPPGSKATSLRGGYLMKCVLREYSTTRDLVPDYKSNRLLSGHILAHAAGPLVVGFDDNSDEPTKLRRARIWGGAVSHLDRPFFFVLNKDQKFAYVADAVARRINAMFPDDSAKREAFLKSKRILVLDEITQQLNNQLAAASIHRGNTARAFNKEMVQCNVPYAYRFNPERYLRVAMKIPLQEDADKMVRYRKRLEQMLLDPKDTIRAALRLEALGKDSITALKHGLASEHPLVRFSSAEALAYLDSVAGCEELARLAKEYSVFRAYCLMALASLEEGVCREHLSNMLASDDAELRCGAFHCLRQIDENEKHLNGELVNHVFWLYQPAPGSNPLVYFASHERPEIALFGSGIHLTPAATATRNIRILAGEFSVSADAQDDRCTVTRFFPQQGTETRRQCTMALDDVLRTMVGLGGQYTDLISFLAKAGQASAISCPVRSRILPEEEPVETLAQIGEKPELLK